MFKKVAFIAAVVAMALPIAASATVGQGNSVSTTFQATAKVQPSCSKLNVPALNFGNEIPEAAALSIGSNGFNFTPGNTGNYANLNTTNDCTVGAAMAFSFTSANNCNLVGPGGATIPYIIWDANGWDALNCSAGGGNTSSTAVWGNNVTFYGNLGGVSFSTPSGTYSDTVTATMYF